MEAMDFVTEGEESDSGVMGGLRHRVQDLQKVQYQEQQQRQ